MKQFEPNYELEPLQLMKKEKCKVLTVDYYEMYIAIIDTMNKLHIFNLSTLSKLHCIELPQDEYSIAFGYKSQSIGLYSKSEILIYELEELQQIKCIKMDDIIKFEFDPRNPNNYYILGNTYLANSLVRIEVHEPITIHIIYNSTTYNLVLACIDRITLLQDLNEMHNHYQELTKKVSIKIDEASQRIAILDSCEFSMLRIVDSKFEVEFSKLEQKVERILDGCFFNLPYYKQHEYIGDTFVYFAMSKRKLGNLVCTVDLLDRQTHYEQCPYQERKCRTITPILKWGNHILGHFEQGFLFRIKLYKSVQFEKLDHKFVYYPVNKVYWETEDEFDKPLKQPQKPLDPALFAQPIYDPYNLYAQLN